ncbi:FAD binding domain-containing protein [Aquimarina sp. MAR_2010_214]|uniref:FAD-binding protein n=1 Tax=Aquimarina sp. MAR_2010_214 TaxID=1250026 RepID=UPI000C7067CA|nr:FAD-binding protein [Aquimarina sp. MAR_2010_214]PKV51461.1 FAD binding domain-containing protein [Aquimarina sp. MAR_2010_214]
MGLPKGIEILPIRKWENRHQNFTQKLTQNASFKVRNDDSLSKGADKYIATTKNLQWLIGHAIDENIRLRAMGSGWSFSKVAVSEGGILDTKSLRLSFSVSKPNISNEYLNKGGLAEDLFFVQCGVSVLQLNSKLEKEKRPNRSIKASGASNGQTVAGALSTGTHGAAFNVGAIQDFVTGIHLIVDRDRHVWLERSSNPIVSDRFIDWLGADLIRDDTMFNAALVSFGSFGIIHGIMIETEPKFLLEEHRIDKIAYNSELKSTMKTLDFSTINHILPFPQHSPDRELYHFEILINPYDFEPDNNNKGVFLKVSYKRKYRENYTRRVPDDKGLTYGDDLLGLIQTVMDSLGGLSILLVPKLVNILFPLAYKEIPPMEGTIGETFSNTKFRGKVASAALGIDIKDSVRVVEEIMMIIEDGDPFPGGISLRYVKGTDALLGFTKFPETCVLELDGVDANITRKFYEKVWNRLEAINIPYTLHWGKINFNLNFQRIQNMYGTATVQHWLDTRNDLLDSEAMNVFTNGFIERCGLNKSVGAIV